MTDFESDEYVYQAIRAGASGFLVKDTEPADLLQAVRVVAKGDALLSPSVTRRLITDLATRPERTPPSDSSRRVLARLTSREREVLALVAEGLSNDEIAARLYLSPLTSKTHVSRIMTKLDAHDRAQLVVIAYESGLVTPAATTAANTRGPSTFGPATRCCPNGPVTAPRTVRSARHHAGTPRPASAPAGCSRNPGARRTSARPAATACRDPCLGERPVHRQPQILDIHAAILASPHVSVLSAGAGRADECRAARESKAMSTFSRPDYGLWESRRPQACMRGHHASDVCEAVPRGGS